MARLRGKKRKRKRVKRKERKKTVGEFNLRFRRKPDLKLRN